MAAADTVEARAARGDRAAFSALMAETRSDLHRFIRRYVGEDGEAHDVLQETYVAAWLASRVGEVFDTRACQQIGQRNVDVVVQVVEWGFGC